MTGRQRAVPRRLPIRRRAAPCMPRRPTLGADASLCRPPGRRGPYVLTKIAQARSAETVVITGQNLLHLGVRGIHPVGEGDDAVPFVQVTDLIAISWSVPCASARLPSATWAAWQRAAEMLNALDGTAHAMPTILVALDALARHGQIWNLILASESNTKSLQSTDVKEISRKSWEANFVVDDHQQRL